MLSHRPGPRGAYTFQSRREPERRKLKLWWCCTAVYARLQISVQDAQVSFAYRQSRGISNLSHRNGACRGPYTTAPLHPHCGRSRTAMPHQGLAAYQACGYRYHRTWNSPGLLVHSGTNVLEVYALYSFDHFDSLGARAMAFRISLR